MIRTYSELSKLKTFQERYEYLKLDSRLGEETFGFDRYLNQVFYRSKEWRWVRPKVIIRDEGFDLGVEGYPCGYGSIVHHMNPISPEQILNADPSILNPEYLILCSDDTHDMIHFGKEGPYCRDPIERRPNDQCPWK